MSNLSCSCSAIVPIFTFHPISVDTLFDENDKLKKEIKELRHIIASMNTKINHLTLQINQLNK